MRTAFVVIAAFIAIVAAGPSSAQDKGLLAPSTGKSLEDQLACLKAPQPALAIRAMIKNGIVAKTNFGADGSPVFRPTADIRVFGAKVLFISGWEMEGERVRDPFWRGPGTAPPLFLSVVVDALPSSVPYREHVVRGTDGVAIGSFSSMEASNQAYAKGGTTITCYGG